jgi:hypothetical protein
MSNRGPDHAGCGISAPLSAPQQSAATRRVRACLAPRDLADDNPLLTAIIVRGVAQALDAIQVVRQDVYLVRRHVH